MKKFTSDSQKIGQLGEEIICRFLVKHSFLIKERNFTRKYGEIDIIAEKSDKLHFVEVKSVTHETAEGYRPEDNLHTWKLKRLSRAIQAYLLKSGISEEQEWQFDVAIVYLNMEKKTAKVEILEDVIL